MQQTQVQARGALWRVQLLGGVRAEGLDRVVERFPTQKTTALFAYLALHAERPHPREELLDLLWPDAPLEATRNRLNQALSSLRRQFEGPEADFGSVLLSDRLTVQVNPALVVTDVSAFESGRAAA
ncbi:MAG TPA: winged helix-turn-helix domain-containing protein, partial [Armatimonadaceae bacterium]|nr:winged helix-turn-helix domain-containing protein [Armatimonadaceae bacterium]